MKLFQVGSHFTLIVVAALVAAPKAQAEYFDDAANRSARLQMYREQEAAKKIEIQNRVQAYREQEAIKREEIRQRVANYRAAESSGYRPGSYLPQSSPTPRVSGRIPTQYGFMVQDGPYIEEFDEGFYPGRDELRFVSPQPSQYVQQSRPTVPTDFHQQMTGTGWAPRKTRDSEVTSIDGRPIPRWAIYYRYRNGRVETYPAEDPKITAERQKLAQLAEQQRLAKEQKAREEAERERVLAAQREQARLKAIADAEAERQRQIAEAEAERQRQEAIAAEAKRKHEAEIEAERQRVLAEEKAAKDRQDRFHQFEKTMDTWKADTVGKLEKWREDWMAKVGNPVLESERKWRTEKLQKLEDLKEKPHIANAVRTKIEAQAIQRLPPLETIQADVQRAYTHGMQFIDSEYANFLNDMRQNDNTTAYTKIYEKKLAEQQTEQEKTRAELDQRYAAEMKRRESFGEIEDEVKKEIARYPLRWTMPANCPYLFQTEADGETTLFLQKESQFQFAGYVKNLKSFAWFEDQAALVADSIELSRVPNVPAHVKEQVAELTQRNEQPVLVVIDRGIPQHVLGGFADGIKPHKVRPMPEGKWRLWLEDGGKPVDYVFEIDRQTGAHDINEAPSLGNGMEFFEK